MDRTQPWSVIAATGAQHTRCRAIPRYPEGLYDLGQQLYAWNDYHHRGAACNPGTDFAMAD